MPPPPPLESVCLESYGSCEALDGCTRLLQGMVSICPSGKPPLCKHSKSSNAIFRSLLTEVRNNRAWWLLSSLFGQGECRAHFSSLRNFTGVALGVRTLSNANVYNISKVKVTSSSFFSLLERLHLYACMYRETSKTSSCWRLWKQVVGQLLV